MSQHGSKLHWSGPGGTASAAGGTSAHLPALKQSSWGEEEGLMGPSQLCAIAITVSGSPAGSRSLIIFIPHSSSLPLP